MAVNLEMIPWLAVILAIVANFILGFLWYAKFTPTGRIWMRAQGLDPAKMDKPAPGDLLKGLIIQVFGAVLIMTTLAYVFIAMKQSYNTAPYTWMDGLWGGFFVWLGFFLPVQLGGLAWERKTPGFVAVNAGYWLVSLLVAGALIAGMMK